jgi:hypothetical protein
MKPYFALAGSVVFLILMLGSEATGDMIPTDDIVSPGQDGNNKQIILSSLQREEVKAVLLEHGADPSQIEQRLDQLTEEELDTLARQFEQLPAAGSANLDVILIGSGVIVLLLEITGVIDLTTAF